jgi:hypothetical protein
MKQFYKDLAAYFVLEVERESPELLELTLAFSDENLLDYRMEIAFKEYDCHRYDELGYHLFAAEFLRAKELINNRFLNSLEVNKCY